VSSIGLDSPVSPVISIDFSGIYVSTVRVLIVMSDAGYLVRDMFVLGPIAFLSKYCGRMFGRTCTTTKCAANARTIIAMVAASITHSNVGYIEWKLSLRPGIRQSSL